jgi:hypothetical protein
LLSAFAAVVYVIATVTLAVGSPVARRIAVLSCSVELAGVLAVGSWSLADPATFPDATVWSGYGSGYGFVPLVLPVFGLLWLRRWTGRPRTRRTIVSSAPEAGQAAGGGVDYGEGGRTGHGADDVIAGGRTQRTSPAGSPNPRPHRTRFRSVRSARDAESDRSPGTRNALPAAAGAQSGRSGCLRTPAAARSVTAPARGNRAPTRRSAHSDAAPNSSTGAGHASAGVAS